MTSTQTLLYLHRMLAPYRHRLIFYTWECLLGGVCYALIEVLYRGHTHPLMIVLGGLCMVGIDLVGQLFVRHPTRYATLFSMLLSTVLVLLLELTFGLVCNRLLQMRIWDYSKERFALWGQICPRFALYWFFLSFPALQLSRVLHRFWFGTRQPIQNTSKQSEDSIILSALEQKNDNPPTRRK